MANSLSAKKRARQAVVRRSHNVGQRSLVRTVVKKVIAAIEEKNIETAKSNYAVAVSVMDKMANKNIIHKNKVARYKSRLNAKIKALSAA